MRGRVGVQCFRNIWMAPKQLYITAHLIVWAIRVSSNILSWDYLGGLSTACLLYDDKSHNQSKQDRANVASQPLHDQL